MFIFFQNEWTPTLVQGGVTLLVATVPAVLTFLTMRQKNRGDALSSVTVTCNLLAKELKTAVGEFPVFRQTIKNQDEKIHRLGAQAKANEDLAQSRYECVEKMKTDAQIVVENMSHISFITTGASEDESVFKRLRAIREAGARMSEVAESCK